ncbi:MAG: hypothetical protein KC478_10400 [Bacteriovoracaceae bacterium]|nr:hypothetical protein [Bacteriovoracaceae bacterium]
MNLKDQKTSSQKLNVYVHDIKSSLQSLVMANELVLESQGELNSRSEMLLKTMLNDIKKIGNIVNRIESDYITRREQ